MKLPALPDGLVVIVKRECETCRMVVPVIEQLNNGSLPVTVYVQDDPAFPESLAPIHAAIHANCTRAWSVTHDDRPNRHRRREYTMNVERVITDSF